MIVRGRVWTFGDGIDTDIIIPARYLVLPLDAMKHHAMEPVRPEFASAVRAGDVLVGGRNFGCGSSREQAPAVLKELGVSAIVAHSFAHIFFRNAINVGLPVVECPGAVADAREGQTVEIDPGSGSVVIQETATRFEGSTLPEFLLAIIEDGGLIPHLLAQGR